jgi:hypothetical protein
MPFVSWHGFRLRSGWPKIDGAIGISIAMDLASRTTYTVTAWRSPEDLKTWVRSPAHAPLMRNYRSRLQSSAADIWQVETFDLRAAWREAMMRVGPQVLVPAAKET